MFLVPQVWQHTLQKQFACTFLGFSSCESSLYTFIVKLFNMLESFSFSILRPFVRERENFIHVNGCQKHIVQPLYTHDSSPLHKWIHDPNLSLNLLRIYVPFLSFSSTLFKTIKKGKSDIDYHFSNRTNSETMWSMIHSKIINPCLGTQKWRGLTQK